MGRAHFSVVALTVDGDTANLEPADLPWATPEIQCNSAPVSYELEPGGILSLDAPWMVITDASADSVEVRAWLHSRGPSTALSVWMVLRDSSAAP